MDLITALAVSIGVLGGIATFVLLVARRPGHSNLGCVHRLGDVLPLRRQGGRSHQGAHEQHIRRRHGLDRAAAGHPGPAWRRRSAFRYGPAICVLITVFILVYAAKAPALSDIPAGVLGYAAVARSRLDGQQAWRGHLGLAREPVRCRRDLPDHRRDARIHFPEDRLGAGQDIAGGERRETGVSVRGRSRSASRRLSANRGRPAGLRQGALLPAKRISG